jgi:hypothetical protein
MRRALLISIVVIFIISVLKGSLTATQARQDQDVLAALLVEVRGLRAAMEQLAIAGPRVQLSMGRLQLQEQRIATLVRRLDSIRDRRLDTETELTNYKELLETMRREAPASPETERELKQLELAMGQAKARQAALENEEISLNQEMAMEQGRWSEINQRLEELDRALTRR